MKMQELRKTMERDHAKASQLLDEIRPLGPKRRFLQWWDRNQRVLFFGCGDDQKGIQIGSDGSVEQADGARPSKLPIGTVRAFIAGARERGRPVADVETILREHIVLEDDRLYILMSQWIAGTYVYSMFSHYGYFFLHSQMPRCGKTRTEEVTSHLAFEATVPRNAPTPPSIRETATEGGTAIFDTLERWQERGRESYAAAMELLDAGFRNGGSVVKMVQGHEGEWRQESYPVYAPYMFAAINKSSLTDTAIDRSFTVEMRRKSTKRRLRPYDDARCEASCEPVRNRLDLSALTHAGRISEVYESPELGDLVHGLGLHDRAADIWKPLIAVAMVLADKRSVDVLCELAQDMSPDPDRQEERRQLLIVRGLRSVAGGEGTLAGTTQQIGEMLRKVTEVDCVDLHGDLSRWGFVAKMMRLDAFDTPRRAWEIQDRELAEIETSLSDEGAPSKVATTTTTQPAPGDQEQTEEAAS